MFNFFNNVIYPSWVIIFIFLAVIAVAINYLFTLQCRGVVGKHRELTKNRLAKHLSEQPDFNNRNFDAFNWVKHNWESKIPSSSYIENLLNDSDYLEIVWLAEQMRARETE